MAAGKSLSLRRSHLKIVRFRPPGGSKEGVCAAIWKQDARVRMVAPLMRRTGGVLDPRPFLAQFGDDLFALDELERSMEMLDALCFAAIDPRQVRRELQAHPDWHFQCVPYGRTDESLEQAAEMIRAAVPRTALSGRLIAVGVFETIKRRVASEVALRPFALDSAADPELAVLQSDAITVRIALDGPRASALPTCGPMLLIGAEEADGVSEAPQRATSEPASIRRALLRIVSRVGKPEW